jgi:hypothetical protein
MKRELPLASDIVNSTEEAYKVRLEEFKDQIIDHIIGATTGASPTLSINFKGVHNDYAMSLVKWLKGRGYGCELRIAGAVYSDLIITCRGKN